ncbi:MAG TPA: histidine kinase, partial [Aquaticitalea sp.]|nr:histidine kinase [Aquaticitalea sp.]
LALEKIESQNRLQEQRLAISRDLHDNIGAQLSFIVSAIDTIKYYVNDKNDKLTEKLENIGAFAKETIQELRDTIWAMNKSDIMLKDLQSRIANFIEKAKQSQHNINISVEADKSISADLKFTALQGLNIFRIIQEATNNSLKYAEANHIQIQISQKENNVNFLVQDDGKGFVETEVEAGNGLLNMRKRAEELGGELILLSEAGKGTTITFNV